MKSGFDATQSEFELLQSLSQMPLVEAQKSLANTQASTLPLLPTKRKNKPSEVQSLPVDKVRMLRPGLRHKLPTQQLP